MRSPMIGLAGLLMVACSPEPAVEQQPIEAARTDVQTNYVAELDTLDGRSVSRHIVMIVAPDSFDIETNCQISVSLADGQVSQVFGAYEIEPELASPWRCLENSMADFRALETLIAARPTLRREGDRVSLRAGDQTAIFQVIHPTAEH